jgi:hypothetical protein
MIEFFLTAVATGPNSPLLSQIFQKLVQKFRSHMLKDLLRRIKTYLHTTHAVDLSLSQCSGQESYELQKDKSSPGLHIIKLKKFKIPSKIAA